MHFRQLSFHVLNVNVIRASHLSNISMRHFFFSHRTYFDNIVAIDSLLEHIMVSVISAVCVHSHCLQGYTSWECVLGFVCLMLL